MYARTTVLWSCAYHPSQNLISRLQLNSWDFYYLFSVVALVQADRIMEVLIEIMSHTRFKCCAVRWTMPLLNVLFVSHGGDCLTENSLVYDSLFFNTHSCIFCVANIHLVLQNPSQNSIYMNMKYFSLEKPMYATATYHCMLFITMTCLVQMCALFKDICETFKS
jgi:hypothetical protein